MPEPTDAGGDSALLLDASWQELLPTAHLAKQSSVRLEARRSLLLAGPWLGVSITRLMARRAIH